MTNQKCENLYCENTTLTAVDPSGQLYIYTICGDCLDMQRQEEQNWTD